MLHTRDDRGDIDKSSTRGGNRLNTIFMIAGENPKAGGDGPRRLFTGGADMIGYLLFLLLIVVILGVKVKLIIGPP